MTLSDIVKLLGGVALFLFGMTLMGDSLKKVAGTKLEVFLYKLTGSPLKGILLGTGVTAIIQSSSATSAMVVGFVNSGMMKLNQAISIIMGAIIGTSITGWVISLSYIGTGNSGMLELFSTSTLASLIGVIGILLIMVSKKRKQKNIGEILLGFTILMVGMEQMSGAVSGLRSEPTFLNLFTSFSNPAFGIGFGMLFTALIQSASAAVGIIQALSSTGVITVDMTVPILIGIAIGASLPVIISSIGANVDAKKAAYSYLVIDVVGGLLFAVIFYALNFVFHFNFLDNIVNPVSIAFINTMIRVVMILMLSPFIKTVEKLVGLMVKDNNDEEQSDTNLLEERFLQYPPLACENVTQVINTMAGKVLDITFSAISLLDNFDEKKFAKVEKKEVRLDEYEDKINIYLTKMASKSLNGYQSRLVGRYLHSVGDLERISDHALNIAQLAQAISEDKVVFSSDSKKELDLLLEAIKKVSTMCMDSFITSDIEQSYAVEPLEQVVDKIVDKMRENHIERLQNGECNVQSGYIFDDLLNNFERVSDHCSNIALATIGSYDKNFDTHTFEIDIRKEDHFLDLYRQYLDELNYYDVLSK